jgi:alkaline phosphatase D
VLASEFVCNGITSQGPAADRLAALLARNPHIRFARSEEKGYVRMELDARTLAAELVGVESVKVRNSPARVVARFVVESGKPGARAA